MIGSAYSEVAEALATEGAKDLAAIIGGIRDKNELLLDAAYSLDERVIVAALEAGADPNARSAAIGAQGAETPLHRAVRGHGDGNFEKIAKILIDAGADTNARNAAKDTPLHAAMYEREDRVIVLINLGLDPNVLDDSAQPLFIKAILLNMMELAQLLLTNGVPVDTRDLRGQTALLVATREGRISAVKFLLEHGADPNAADVKHYTAKRVALESEDPHLEVLFNPPTNAAVHAPISKAEKSGCAINSAVLMVLFLLSIVIWASRQ